MPNFCKETLKGTRAVEVSTLKELASECASDPFLRIRSEKVAEWFISILPAKSTQSLFPSEMFPICSSPNTDVSKLRWNVAVKDDVDFLLLSFKVFLAKEKQKPLCLGCLCFLGDRGFQGGQWEKY